MIIINFLGPLRKTVDVTFDIITTMFNIEQNRISCNVLNTTLIHVMLSSVIILYLVIPSSIQSRKYLYILDLSSITSYIMTWHIITIHYINGLSGYDINQEGQG